MKHFIRLKYPKLIVLTIVIILAYIIFSKSAIREPLQHLGSTGSYLATFIGGILFAFGFTVPIAAGIFITVDPSNLIFAAMLGGIGSVLGDLVIMNVIRKAYQDEFNKLKHSKLINEVRNLLRRQRSALVRHYLLYVIAGIIIVLPIPDEVGISMLAGFTHMKQSTFSIVSFVLHSIGTLILLWVPVAL